MKRFIFLVIALTLGFFHMTHAQTADISLSSIPSDPQPLQTVTITAESFGVDLNQANITWQYNGRTIDGGVGRKSISITAPAGGATGTITMTASGTSFTSTNATLILRPASIDLLWEAADSYTPPFYKGKALPVTNSLIRVTAVPSSAAPKQLVYTWSRDNTVLGSLSGYGKNSLLLRNSELDASERIAVSGQSGTFSGTSNITITPGNPSLVVYQKNEGFIDYANGSSTALNTTAGGLILRMEPYFFSTPTSPTQNLAFAITETNVNITNSTTPNELYLSAPDTRGNSLFTIAVEAINFSLQQISRNFSINFI